MPDARKPRAMMNKKGNTPKAGRARPAAGRSKGGMTAASASPLRLIGLALIGVGVIAVVPTVLELLQGGGPEDLTGLLVRLLPGPLLVLGGLALMERARSGGTPSSPVGELGLDSAPEASPMPAQPWSQGSDDALANSSAWGFWSSDAEAQTGGAPAPAWAGSSAAAPAAPADLGAAWLGAGPAAEPAGGVPSWGAASAPGGFSFDLGGPTPAPSLGGGFDLGGPTPAPSFGVGFGAAAPTGPVGFEAAFAAATPPAPANAPAPFAAAAAPPFEFGTASFGGPTASAPSAAPGFEAAFAPVPPPSSVAGLTGPFATGSPQAELPASPLGSLFDPVLSSAGVPPATSTSFGAAVPFPATSAAPPTPVVPPMPVAPPAPAAPSPLEAALVVPPAPVAPPMPAPVASAPPPPPVRPPEPAPTGVATLVPNVQIVKAGTRLVLDATDPQVIERYRNWVLDQATGATAFEPLRVDGQLDQWFLLSACGVATLLSWTHEDHGATYPKEVWVDQILPEQGIAIADRELATELIVAAALHAGGVYTPPSAKLRGYQPAELVTSMAAMHVGLLRLYCALERTDPAKVLRDQLGAPNVDAAAAVGAAPRLLAPGW